MPRAYCADMRTRVIARVEGRVSRREATEHYEVGPSTAVIWVKCFCETGRCAAKPRGGSISQLEEHAEFLLALLDEQPDLTLDEVVAVMRRNKVPGSRTAVWRFFRRHEITFKKSAARGGTGARGAVRPLRQVQRGEADQVRRRGGLTARGCARDHLAAISNILACLAFRRVDDQSLWHLQRV
jgi:transposase